MIPFLDKNKTILISIGIAVVLSYFLVLVLLDWDAKKTREATIQAEVRAREAHEQLLRLEGENERIRTETEAREAERAKRETELLEAIASAQRLAQAARESENRANQALAAARSRRERDIDNVASQSDQALALATVALADQTHPDVSGPVVSARSDSWFEINRSAAEIFNAALIEVRSNREEISQLNEINAQRQIQITQLNENLAAQKEQILSLNLSITDFKERLDALETTLVAAQSSSERYRKLADSRLSEFNAYKRRAKFRKVRNIVTTGAALAGAYYVGTLGHN